MISEQRKKVKMALISSRGSEHTQRLTVKNKSKGNKLDDLVSSIDNFENRL